MPRSKPSKNTVIGARRSTDKLQVSGYRLMVQRIEQALISRDVRDFGSRFAGESGATWIGIGMVLLICVAGAALGFLNPSGKAGDAKILATKAGARYVVVDGRVHPVTNLASARLIAGTSDGAKNVSDKDLERFPRGQLMGIPAAPDEMSARGDDTVVWAVCSQHDVTSALDLVESDDSTTLLVSGADALTDQGRVPSDVAVLVSSMAPASGGGEDTRKTWLLLNGHRMEVTSSDRSLLAVLNLTDADLESAAPVSHEMISSVPARALFARPDIERDGQPSRVLSGEYEVGTVLVTDGLDEPERWVVLADGVQRVGPFAAEMLLSTGSQVLRGISRSTIDQTSHTASAQFGNWPWAVPAVRKGPASVCYRWDRTGTGPVEGSFAIGSGLPVTRQAREDAAWLLPARTRTPQADAFYTRPGQGWLVTASGSTEDSQIEGQLWWVSDAGVRYAIAGDADTPIDKVVSILGLGGATPVAVPWPTLQLLPVGGTLAPENARVVHATIPIDKAQGTVPSAKELN